MSLVPHPLETLISSLGLYAGQAPGVSANMLTVALADILNDEAILRLGSRVFISSTRAQSNVNQDWCIALFLHLENEGVGGKLITSEGKTRDTPVKELLVEKTIWRAAGLTETTEHLRRDPAFKAARALVNSELMRLDAPLLPTLHRPSPRL